MYIPKLKTNLADDRVNVLKYYVEPSRKKIKQQQKQGTINPRSLKKITVFFFLQASVYLFFHP